MAEQLALDQLARDRRHVDGDERPVAALAVVVQRAGDQLLAGARLADDHHGEVGAHQPRQHPVDFLHGRRAADEGKLLLDLALGEIGRGVHLRRRQGAFDDVDQFVEVERLWQVLEGAPLRRLDGGHERVLRAHHDDPQVGTELADARDEVEPVLVRHHHVGDDQIALAVRDPAPQRRGVAGGAHLVAGAGQRLAQDRADGAVVVGDEKGVRTHVTGPPPSGCIGSITRNTVRRGWLSNSMTPP